MLSCLLYTPPLHHLLVWKNKTKKNIRDEHKASNVGETLDVFLSSMLTVLQEKAFFCLIFLDFLIFFSTFRFFSNTLVCTGSWCSQQQKLTLQISHQLSWFLKFVFGLDLRRIRSKLYVWFSVLKSGLKPAWVHFHIIWSFSRVFMICVPRRGWGSTSSWGSFWGLDTRTSSTSPTTGTRSEIASPFLAFRSRAT